MNKTSMSHASDPAPVSLKGCFPFRLGTTSYILPADILPNLEYLADKVDDVQLVLFESDEISNIPARGDVAQMQQLGRAHDLRFVVHLPLDVFLGHAGASERARSVARCRRVIERMNPAEPFAYVLHLEGDTRDRMPSADMSRWLRHTERSLQELTREVPSRRLCVENLGYPLHLLDDVLERVDLSVCLDVGHALLYGYPVDKMLQQYLARLRVLHVHGIEEGKDHRGLSALAAPVLERLLDAAGDPAPGSLSSARSFIVEVFGEDDFQDSMRVLARYAQEPPTGSSTG